MVDHTLQETLDKVTEEDVGVDSIVALVNGLRTQVNELLAGTTLAPSVQEAVNSIFDKAVASADKINTALSA